jgi:hypothetical protein
MAATSLLSDAQTLDASSVVPIKGVKLGIGVLELKCQFVAGGDATIYRITHFRLFVFEAIWRRDTHPVFLAGRRLGTIRSFPVFYGLYIASDDIRDPKCRAPFISIHIYADRSYDRLDDIRDDTRENLPVRPAVPTSGESD